MLKFQAVAEKTAKNFRGYFFAAPCILRCVITLRVTSFQTLWKSLPFPWRFAATF